MSEESKGPQAVVVDLGKQKASRVKKLRKGKGKLMDDVHETLADLSESGVIGENAVPVVFVVERKDDVSFMGMRMPKGMKMK